MDAGVMTGVVQVRHLPVLAMDDRGLTVGHLYTTFVLEGRVLMKTTREDLPLSGARKGTSLEQLPERI